MTIKRIFGTFHLLAPITMTLLLLDIRGSSRTAGLEMLDVPLSSGKIAMSPCHSATIAGLIRHHVKVMGENQIGWTAVPVRASTLVRSRPSYEIARAGKDVEKIVDIREQNQNPEQLWIRKRGQRTDLKVITYRCANLRSLIQTRYPAYLPRLVASTQSLRPPILLEPAVRHQFLTGQRSKSSRSAKTNSSTRSEHSESWVTKTTSTSHDSGLVGLCVRDGLACQQCIGQADLLMRYTLQIWPVQFPGYRRSLCYPGWLSILFRQLTLLHLSTLSLVTWGLRHKPLPSTYAYGLAPDVAVIALFYSMKTLQLLQQHMILVSRNIASCAEVLKIEIFSASF